MKKAELKFEFAKYTDVTEMAFKQNPEYKKNNVIKVFLCCDVFDTWICRLISGLDEEYNEKENSYLLERNNIPHRVKGDKLSFERAIKILKEDEFENYDYKTDTNPKNLINMIDGGFGINNYKDIF